MSRREACMIFKKKLSVENNHRLNTKPEFHFPCQKVTSLGLKTKIVEIKSKKFFNQKNDITIVFLIQNKA